jgi:hypothetical protein
MYLRICGSFKSAKNNCVRKSQIRKLPHLRKIRKPLKNWVSKFKDLRTFVSHTFYIFFRNLKILASSRVRQKLLE